MKSTIINLPRCGGKTTALVYASAVDKVPILCLNKQNKKYIEDLAKKLGLDIPEPLTCHTEDIINLSNLDLEGILIDEADVVIPTLIGALTGVKVKGMTMSVPMNYPSNATQVCLSRLQQREANNETFNETAKRLMDTVRMRSFDEAAKDAADHLAETLKNFGFSVN